MKEVKFSQFKLEENVTKREAQAYLEIEERKRKHTMDVQRRKTDILRRSKKIKPNVKKMFDNEEVKFEQELNAIIPRERRNAIQQFVNNFNNVSAMELDKAIDNDYAGFLRVCLKNCHFITINDQNVINSMARPENRINSYWALADVSMVYLGDNITEIPDEAFKLYMNLGVIDGGENVQKIGREAMLGCENLIVFGAKNARYIHPTAFCGCFGLDLSWLNDGRTQEQRDKGYKAIKEQMREQYEKCIKMSEKERNELVGKILNVKKADVQPKQEQAPQIQQANVQRAERIGVEGLKKNVGMPNNVYGLRNRRNAAKLLPDDVDLLGSLKKAQGTLKRCSPFGGFNIK